VENQPAKPHLLKKTREIETSKSHFWHADRGNSLGALLNSRIFDPMCATRVSELPSNESSYFRAHRPSYEALFRLLQREPDEPLGCVLPGDELYRMKKLDEIRDVKYLSLVLTGVLSPRKASGRPRLLQKRETARPPRSS
jgi:replicative DNA helicase